MPSFRPAAEIHPSQSIASSRSALPGPIAMSAPQWICSLIVSEGGSAGMDGYATSKIASTSTAQSNGNSATPTVDLT